jgi:peptidyl-prolyl cis-trans isomerase SurA
LDQYVDMKKIFLLAIFSFTMAIAFAQPSKLTVDKVIAVVGNKLVLKSDVEDRIMDMQRQGVEIPDNAKCYLLQDFMGTKTLVLQAEKDSLPVSDEDVETEIDNKIRTYLNQYGGKDELEKIAGKTIYQLKEEMHDPIRDQKLAQAMRNKIIGDVRITPFEVKNYFNKIPVDSLPFYESLVEIGQIVVFPKANKDAEDYCKEELAGYKDAIEKGKISFKKSAQINSEEPGANQRYGQMEVNRNQKDIDPTFLSKAFTLKEGQITNPFKTKFGYHILELVSRNGDDALVRHIIKIPQVTNKEIAEGFAKLDTVRSKLIAGTLDFGTAVNKYSDDDYGKFTAGMIQGPNGSFLAIDELDKEIVPILKTLKVGAYSQPIAYTDASGKRGVRILFLKSKSEPHRENLEQDYSKISGKALALKKETALEKWFDEKLDGYFIKIDSEYVGCESMKPWVKAMAAKK